MWSIDLRPGDILFRRTGWARDQVFPPDQPNGWCLKVMGSSGPIGKAVFFTHEQIEAKWKQPSLDVPNARAETRALLMLTTHYDDGRKIETPWVEGAPCDLDSFEGVSFQYLGHVDARAAALDIPDLWVHRDELLAGTYRFVGEFNDPPVSPRQTDPEVEDDRPTATRRRGNGRWHSR